MQFLGIFHFLYSYNSRNFVKIYEQDIPDDVFSSPMVSKGLSLTARFLILDSMRVLYSWKFVSLLMSVYLLPNGV